MSELPLAITKLVGLKSLSLSGKLVHQLSSVCWRFASAFRLLLIMVGSICSFPFLFLLLTIGAGNPLQGPQRGISDANCSFSPTASGDCSTVCHHWRRLRGVERVDSISGSWTV
ncbi:MAG: hypothetical protein IPO72_19810 [Saprospiraceae bacterium]|nr:hypothetical protein [Candidatus Vicinibacter affinis]